MSKLWYAALSTIRRNGVLEFNIQLPHNVENIDFIPESERDRLCFDDWTNGIICFMGEGWSVSERTLVDHYMIGVKKLLNQFYSPNPRFDDQEKLKIYKETYNKCFDAYNIKYPEFFV